MGEEKVAVSSVEDIRSALLGYEALNDLPGVAHHRIGVLGGDGVGPELVAEGLRVLDAVARIDGFTYELHHYPHSGAHYRATGELLGQEVIEDIASLESLFFGAVGDPELPEGMMEREILTRLVHGLGLNVGVRPATLYAERLTPLKGWGDDSIDLVIVRDSDEDIFSGPGAQLHRGTKDEVAVAVQAYTRKSVERVLRYAFSLARRRRRRVTLVAQTNAIPAHGLWALTAHEVAEDFADVELVEEYPDAAAMHLVTQPDQFDVLATTMWLGGTLSDLAGAIVGGIGLIGSGRINIDRGFGLFEPAHGSAPKYRGQNRVSPVATLRALAMMLDLIGEVTSRQRIERAIADSLRSCRIDNATTRSSTGTTQATDTIIDALDAAV